MAGRGVPYSPNHDEAFQIALKRISRYKGSQPVFDEAHRDFVQAVVIDALIAAPQPVCEGWVHTSLMATGGLVRWAILNAEPITRENLLSTRTRNRFLNLGVNDLTETSRRNYRCRLDIIATALSGTPVVPATTKTLIHAEPVEPLSDQEVATLWIWANGLRPEKRRQRVIGSMVLSIGCGLRSSELVRVRVSDVHADAHGVHVSVIGKDGMRSVTCARAWEDRLLDLIDGQASEWLLTSPWRMTPATARGLQSALAQAQRTTEAPVRFSPRSLRNTWLVLRLAEGTPIPTLLEAAGVEAIEALKPFLQFIVAPSESCRAESLRGGVQA
ncbi:tyrosine-type recombinase/integrase [Rothia sp. ARF10]|nr:tyrosine-type recombinase/integrase [Rothia sp. ARF10]